MDHLFDYAQRGSDEDRTARIRARYEELCRIIARNNELYYAEAAPEISDAEYDVLYRELEQLEHDYPALITPASPTRHVGNDLTEGFAEVTHPVPMLSIDDIFEKKPGEAAETDTELIQFYERLQAALGAAEPPPVVIEPKIDGCAVTLYYAQGRLKYAATRGNGHVGDDITANVRTIADVPQVLPSAKAPEVLEVRGEIYMLTAEFLALNEQREADGLQTFANPRNATAGAVKLLDPRETARRPLHFLAHGIGAYNGPPLRNMNDYEVLLGSVGIPYNKPILHAAGAEQLRAAVRDMNTLRRTLGFGTDGAVVKLADFALREQLGATTRAPRWAAAFKYLPEQKQTRLRSITVQVGRTGVLTPVAELEPVNISGSVVSRATLHNQDEIDRKDIRIGDTLLVEKAGEIIPSVVRVIHEKRPADAQPYSLPQAVGNMCPSCGAPIAREAGQVAWRCTNFACPAQAVTRTVYFCSRAGIDVEALGGTVAEALVSKGLIRTPLDLFRISTPRLAALNLGTEEEPRRFGEKNAIKARDALRRAASLPLERWLTALGIPTVGAVTAKLLASYHRDFAELANSPYLQMLQKLYHLLDTYTALSPQKAENKKKTQQEKQELTKLRAELVPSALALAAPYVKRGYLQLDNKLRITEKLGPVTCRAVRGYFSSAIGRRVAAELQQLGLNPVSACYRESLAESRQNVLSGISVAITGSFDRPRDALIRKIEEYGGKYVSSVTSATTYLLAGEGGGEKRNLAHHIGVPVITEQDLESMLGGKPTPWCTSALIYGTIALDTISTPAGTADAIPGGSAIYAALAARLTAYDFRLIGVVGDDFRTDFKQHLQQCGIPWQDITCLPGRTFAWNVRYEQDMNLRTTLGTLEGVQADRKPTLPPGAAAECGILALANVTPALQLHLLRQFPTPPSFVLVDFMKNLIEHDRTGTEQLLADADLALMNEEEACCFARTQDICAAGRAILSAGPQYAIVKLGDRGSILFRRETDGEECGVPFAALKLRKTIDPTGAGDSFLGALAGCLTYYCGNGRKPSWRELFSAVCYASVCAAQCCAGFGTDSLSATSRADLEALLRSYITTEKKTLRAFCLKHHLTERDLPKLMPLPSLQRTPRPANNDCAHGTTPPV